MQEEKKCQPTKLPIVLCHGLFGYDRLGPNRIPQLQISYWSGIAEHLRKQGARVYVARVPATGGIEERAFELRKYLDEHLKHQDVNLVCHSMGGLDARYLVSHLPSDRFTVRTLTTVATPHRGSPFMDWVRDNVGVGLAPDDPKRHDLLKRVMAVLDAPAYSNLTTDYLTQKFNPSVPDSPHVEYFSYAAAVDNVSLLSPIRIPWEIVKAREGDNDGFVSVHSARWGTLVETLRADHFDVFRIKRAPLYSYLPAVSLNLAPLFGLASYIKPLISHLPNPAALLPASLTLSSATAKPDVRKVTAKTSHAAAEAKKHQSDDGAAYKKRIEELLNHMHGPTSFNEYVYGMDHEVPQ